MLEKCPTKVTTVVHKCHVKNIVRTINNSSGRYTIRSDAKTNSSGRIIVISGRYIIRPDDIGIRPNEILI